MKNLIVREETVEDASDIEKIVLEAFQYRIEEPEIVRLARQRDQILMSLVAIENRQIVGHILVTPIELSVAVDDNFGAIGPLAVKPSCQLRGIGSRLMNAVVSRAGEENLSALFLLGNPCYYERFGFSTSHIGNEYGATEAFMHLEISPGVLNNLRGMAKYVNAFSDAGA